MLCCWYCTPLGACLPLIDAPAEFCWVLFAWLPFILEKNRSKQSFKAIGLLQVSHQCRSVMLLPSTRNLGHHQTIDKAAPVSLSTAKKNFLSQIK
jgi:hypothetical protein